MVDQNPVTVERLERWVLFGGALQFVLTDSGGARIDLCTCTGELVERLRSDDPGVVRYLRESELD